MAAKKKTVFVEFQCPDCHIPHRWEKLGARSNLLLRKKKLTGQNYGWKTIECKGPSAREGRLYVEAVAA